MPFSLGLCPHSAMARPGPDGVQTKLGRDGNEDAPDTVGSYGSRLAGVRDLAAGGPAFWLASWTALGTGYLPCLVRWPHWRPCQQSEWPTERAARGRGGTPLPKVKVEWGKRCPWCGARLRGGVLPSLLHATSVLASVCSPRPA